MMSLEEARNEHDQWATEYWDAPGGSERELVANTNLKRLIKIIKFHEATQTQQLCQAAQMITEDTIEARSDNSKD